MAEIVAAFGVPHTPNFPALVAKQGPDCRTAQLYAQVAALLRDASPDVLVIYTDDHFNTFFLDNFPTFAVGIADQISGPNDQTAMPSYRVAGEASLASHVRARVIAAGFDLSLVQDFDLDHSIMVPLHFLTPAMAIPIVPVFINIRSENVSTALHLARPAWVRGDAIRLEQVLINLLRNALDAMGDKPLKRLLIRIQADHGQWHLSVADTGGGIAAEHLANVFDPFFTTKPVGEGLGLGLAVSYAIVHELGGRLQAGNCAEGALFTLTLPADPEPLC